MKNFQRKVVSLNMLSSMQKVLCLILVLITLSFSGLNALKKRETGTLEIILFSMDIHKISIEYFSRDKSSELIETIKYVEFDRENIVISQLLEYIKHTQMLDWWKNSKYIDKLNGDVSHIIKLYYDTFSMSLRYIDDSRILLIGGEPEEFLGAMKTQNRDDLILLIMGLMDDEFDKILYDLFNQS